MHDPNALELSLFKFECRELLLESCNESTTVLYFACPLIIVHIRAKYEYLPLLTRSCPRGVWGCDPLRGTPHMPNKQLQGRSAMLAVAAT